MFHRIHKKQIVYNTLDSNITGYPSLFRDNDRKEHIYMKMVDKDSEFGAIITLFEEDAGSELLTSRVDMQRLILAGIHDEEENELLLRLNTYTKHLVVARIQFIKRRQGFGERFLDLLVQYGKEKGYKQIVFECVLSEHLKKFLTKHGFHLASPEPFEMNWIKDIDSL